MHVFATFLSISRRKEHSRLVRAIVCVLALTLIGANTAAAEMPLFAMNHGTHAMAAHAPDDSHCQGAGDRQANQTRHSQDCPCCDGTSCACAHVCGDVTIFASLGASIVVSTLVCAALPSPLTATLAAPPLRPPIA